MYLLRRGWEQHIFIFRRTSTSTLHLPLTTVATDVLSHSIAITAVCHESRDETERIKWERKRGGRNEKVELWEKESDQHRAKGFAGRTREKSRSCVTRKLRREARAKFRVFGSADTWIRDSCSMSIRLIGSSARVVRVSAELSRHVKWRRTLPRVSTEHASHRSDNSGDTWKHALWQLALQHGACTSRSWAVRTRVSDSHDYKSVRRPCATPKTLGSRFRISRPTPCIR